MKTTIANHIAVAEAARAGVPLHKREEARYYLERLYRHAQQQPRKGKETTMAEAPLLTDNITREQHIQWCKDRALAYVEIGQLSEAITSMFSDLGKHEETKVVPAPLMMLGTQAGASGSRQRVKDFITGFN